ncbi:thioredoxin family protein [candidate division KSB1 bacterium]|nr:thioredoxin family protein [candidate division KSB1 bacterium]NIR69734.1 thioredoxin family protein [candidate division KSB1 bacterium]NIS22922.1 thioredoxin family protein [candidate division KSB1 bacterium]NIT69779.1 thioredoxin family protein [candidate division KSB1 bacterium]NIU23453.1 thioredoxin family protein [candidate division KSB1 bacterium]
MAKDFFDARRAHKGMTYDEYLQLMQRTVENPDIESLDEQQKNRLEYTKLNLQRSQRIQRTYSVSDELCNLLEAIKVKQLWMVLTEPWCGDSAQCLPYIVKFSECNPLIDLKILLRDKNLDIMEHYLTDGKRGIPKLISFDEAGDELLQWGPRPQEAMELFRSEKDAGRSKPEIIEKLHLWYGRNRGKAIEQEFVELMKVKFF